MDPSTESASMYADEDTMEKQALNPATVTVGIVALGIVAVAGSATAIYYEVSASSAAAVGIALPALLHTCGAHPHMQHVVF
jgi:hypothetical protein